LQAIMGDATSVWATGAFAALVAMGGVVGYVNTGSVVSLAAGTAFGLLLAVSAFLMRDRKTRYSGYLLSLVLLGVLGAVMGYRFSLAFKFFPAGLVALLSLSLFAHNLVKSGAAATAKSH